MLKLNERRFRREPSMQHFLANPSTFSAPGIRAVGAGAAGRAARAWFYLLGAIHCPVVLPIRAGALLARNLWRLGGLRRQAASSGFARGAQAFPPGLCQRASALETFSECVR